MTRTPRTSAHREIRSARRREMARSGGATAELAPFDCFSLCMRCGYLTEPSSGDPMRSEAGRLESGAGQARCFACGELGLVDLRHTPTIYSLCELEGSDEAPSPSRRAARLFVLALAAAGLLGLAWLIIANSSSTGTGLGSVVFGLGPIALVGLFLLLPLASGATRTRRARPRRWRLPQHGRRKRLGRRGLVHGRVEGPVPAGAELLRAPLSGRPCVAYEIGVRDDGSSEADPSSWRLLEQANVGFRVGELEVGEGRALLRLPRERSSAGLLMSQDEHVRRFMRMRGLLDCEDVHVYETILVPGDDCVAGRAAPAEPVEVLAALS